MCGAIQVCSFGKKVCIIITLIGLDVLVKMASWTQEKTWEEIN